MQITGERGARRRLVVASVAVPVVVVAVLVATGLVRAPWAGDPPAPAPGGAAPDRRSPAPEAPDAALREGLGGLAALVIADEPELRPCTEPARPPAGSGSPEAGQVDAVTAQVEVLRGLELTDPPEIRLLPDAEMTAQVTEAFGDQWSDERIDLDTRALTALGAIAPGTDLVELRVDAFAQQVSGYHLGGEEVIGVRTGDPDALSPLERVVLAHELEHALSLEHLGRPADHRDGEDESADARRASSAVVEGSAAVTMARYAGAALTPAERVTLRAELRERADRPALADYSPYLRAELQFPYVEGMRYLCRRFLDGGWAAVGEAYRDPPPSTAAVLFPDRHEEQPRDPAALGGPGEGWAPVRTDAFGAAELEWLLAAPGGDPAAALEHPRERVAAWDGGELAVWTRGAGTVVGLALVDRAPGPGTAPLCATVREWYAAAFPDATVTGDDARTVFEADRQQAVLACPGRQVRLGIGPTTEAAGAVTDR